MQLFTTQPSEPILIYLTIAYFLLAAVTTFDIRVTQGIRNNVLPRRDALPSWTGIFVVLMWLVFLAMFLLNWWYALLLIVVRFIFKVLPVLETIGAYLLTPLLGSKHTTRVLHLLKDSYRQQRNAGNVLKEIHDNPDNASEILSKHSSD